MSIGFGADNTLWCSTFTLNDSPNLGIDQIGQHSGACACTGGAGTRTPDLAGHGDDHIDGTAHSVVANRNRTDVATASPSAGAAHGFDQSYQLSEAAHTVCVTANNTGYGSNTSIACRSVTLNYRPPRR